MLTDLVICFWLTFTLPLFIKVDDFWLVLPLLCLGLELRRERWELPLGGSVTALV